MFEHFSVSLSGCHNLVQELFLFYPVPAIALIISIEFEKRKTRRKKKHQKLLEGG